MPLYQVVGQQEVGAVAWNWTSTDRRTADRLTTLSFLMRMTIGEQKANTKRVS